MYNCLADCCHKIKESFDYYDYDISVEDTIFYWDRIQAHDKSNTYNRELLVHLKEQFDLDNIDSCEIEKNGDTITVKTPFTAPIILRHDRNREKVIAMSNIGGRFREIEYNTSKLGSEILVGMCSPKERLLEDVVGGEILEPHNVSNISAAIPIHEEDASNIVGEQTEGGIEVDLEDYLQH